MINNPHRKTKWVLCNRHYLTGGYRRTIPWLILLTVLAVSSTDFDKTTRQQLFFFFPSHTNKSSIHFQCSIPASSCAQGCRGQLESILAVTVQRSQPSSQGLIARQAKTSTFEVLNWSDLHVSGPLEEAGEPGGIELATVPLWRRQCRPLHHRVAH